VVRMYVAPDPPHVLTRTAPPHTPTLTLHDALPISRKAQGLDYRHIAKALGFTTKDIPRMEQQQDQLLSTLYRHAVVLGARLDFRSEEHTSELQSRENLVCRLLLEKK